MSETEIESSNQKKARIYNQIFNLLIEANEGDPKNADELITKFKIFVDYDVRVITEGFFQKLLSKITKEEREKILKPQPEVPVGCFSFFRK
jgi:hypothetical protein